MGLLDGKVAIITGAGRGLGRQEALAMAKEGCNILVNDLGGSSDGTSAEGKIADEVVAEIKKIGSDAIANYDSVIDFEKTKKMIEQAVDKWGKVDIIVNNAGILRDRMIFSMEEKDWDLVLGVHLKGTFNMTRHAAAYWRKVIKSGEREEKGRIINTASDAGLLGNVGQSNYGAAKAGIAAMTKIVAMELRKYATVNCIVPLARTRLTTDATPSMVKVMSTKTNSGFDIFDPKNATPLVLYLASNDADNITGEVFRIAADTCWVFNGWSTVNKINNNGHIFTPKILAERVESELLKDLPPKQVLSDAVKELSEQ
ncbi:MAG: SDR family NAD(P)-dependent oxidoreductase [Promethearchaeota archaeon]